MATPQTAVTHWEEAHPTYRYHLETLSLTLHSFHIADSAPQRSTQVASHLQATLEGIEVLAQYHQLPARPAAITKGRKQVPALMDFWWEGVKRDLAHAALSPCGGNGLKSACSAGLVGAPSSSHTLYAQGSQAAAGTGGEEGVFNQLMLTQCLPPQGLKEWQAWVTHRMSAFQRASSIVEGRSGYLAQMHHNHRGLPKRHYTVWTVLHNFDCRAADGTTPASRFFQRTFPDLFETVISHIEALPQPRRRKHQVALCS